MAKSVIYLHPYDRTDLCCRIADKINASAFYINAKNALTDFDTYDVIGFGVGMDSSIKYQQLLKFVEKMPNVQNKKAFIFTTRGLTSETRMEKDYEAILNLLRNKGFEIMNDFNTKGFNTGSILKCIAEINMGETASCKTPCTNDINKG